MSSAVFPSPRPWTPGRPLRWGILAPGDIAGSFTSAVHEYTEHTISAVGSRSPERAEAFAGRHGIERAYGSYQALVADPLVEAVYVASPHSAHTQLALLAIEAGKHVLVEKPMATTAADVRRIFDAASGAGVFAMEAMWTRYLPQSDIIRQLLKDGVLGDISCVMADFGFAMPYMPEHRLFDPAQAGGALFDAGVYPVSFISSVLGTPTGFTAAGTVAASGVDDHAVLSLHYPDAVTSATASLRSWLPTTASISGSNGLLEVGREFFRPSSLQLTLIDMTSGASVAHWHDEQFTNSRTGGLSCQVNAFAHFVQEGMSESPIHPHDEVIATVDILDRAQKQILSRAALSGSESSQERVS